MTIIDKIMVSLTVKFTPLMVLKHSFIESTHPFIHLFHSFIQSCINHSFDSFFPFLVKEYTDSLLKVFLGPQILKSR